MPVLLRAPVKTFSRRAKKTISKGEEIEVFPAGTCVTDFRIKPELPGSVVIVAPIVSRVNDDDWSRHVGARAGSIRSHYATAQGGTKGQQDQYLREGSHLQLLRVFL
jgi:hypothetical protein